MITYEEARKIAKEHNKAVNCCLVYKDGYRFIFDNGVEKIGTRGFVVLKKNGAILHFLEFASRYDLHGKLRKIKLKNINCRSKLTETISRSIIN